MRCFAENLHKEDTATEESGKLIRDIKVENNERILWSLPVWLMLADMLYGFSANIAKVGKLEPTGIA